MNPNEKIILIHPVPCFWIGIGYSNKELVIYLPFLLVSIDFKLIK